MSLQVSMRLPIGGGGRVLNLNYIKGQKLKYRRLQNMEHEIWELRLYF